ncbi:MAG: flagellar type III secretion system pore protein FliP [Bdellovibrionota bacterium]
MRRKRFYFNFIVLSLIAVIAIPAGAFAADQGVLPDLSINIGGNELATDGSVSSILKMMILISAISFAPAVILTMTSFTRIAVVLGMTRTALGTQSMPPNMVITGLALFLTFAVMNPVVTESYENGIKPFIEGQMGQEEALKEISIPIKKFLIRHSREKDLALFLEVTRSDIPDEPQDVPLYVAVPSFVLSELNIAFQIGFLIALPFLILDMVVSSILTSMSMITLPPVVISLPLKLMLFVVVDGWHLIIGSLVQTYKV